MEFIIVLAMSQSAFVRGFIDDIRSTPFWRRGTCCLNPRSCAASSMTSSIAAPCSSRRCLNPRSCAASSMTDGVRQVRVRHGRLNPRSCAASSMTFLICSFVKDAKASQSAFVRGFIDDPFPRQRMHLLSLVSIRVRARLHR